MLCNPARTANSSDLGARPRFLPRSGRSKRRRAAEATTASLPSNPRRAESPPIERPSLPSVSRPLAILPWPLSGRKAIRDLHREKRERECSPLPMPRAWCPAPFEECFSISATGYHQAEVRANPQTARTWRLPRKESSEAHAAEFPGSPGAADTRARRRKALREQSSRRARSRAPFRTRSSPSEIHPATGNVSAPAPSGTTGRPFRGSARPEKPLEARPCCPTTSTAENEIAGRAPEGPADHQDKTPSWEADSRDESYAMPTN